jgi:MFS family permease
MTHDMRPVPQQAHSDPWLPSGPLGWASLVLTGLPLVLLGLIMFVAPVVGMLLGIEEFDLPALDTWVTPVAMAGSLLAGALLGFLARHRGERSMLVAVLMWIALAFGLVLGVFLAAGA